MAGLLLGAACAAPGSAAAGWQGSVGLASEMVKRGLSVSDGRAALSLDLAQSLTDGGFGLSLGIATPAYPWLGGRGEAQLGIGHLRQLRDDLALELRLVRYEGLGERRARQYAYTEAAATAAWGLGAQQLSLTVALAEGEGLFIAPGPFRRGPSARLELGSSTGLGRGLSLELGLGWQHWRLDRPRENLYGSMGMAWQWQRTRWALAWLDSQAEQRLQQPAARAGGRWVGSVLLGF